MKGAKIDGIGSQIHININLWKQGIDNMFRKLAATGLKIKVLDWIYGYSSNIVLFSLRLHTLRNQPFPVFYKL